MQRTSQTALFSPVLDQDRQPRRSRRAANAARVIAYDTLLSEPPICCITASIRACIVGSLSDEPDFSAPIKVIANNAKYTPSSRFCLTLLTSTASFLAYWLTPSRMKLVAYLSQENSSQCWSRAGASDAGLVPSCCWARPVLLLGSSRLADVSTVQSATWPPRSAGRRPDGKPYRSRRGFSSSARRGTARSPDYAPLFSAGGAAVRLHRRTVDQKLGGWATRTGQRVKHIGPHALAAHRWNRLYRVLRGP